MEKETRNKALLVIAIVLTLGAAWYAWRYWGWFRTGKDKWIFDCMKKMQDNSVTIPDYRGACEKQWNDEHKNEGNFPSNPKIGDVFIKGGIKYSYVCTQTNQGGVPNPQGYKCLKLEWQTDEQIADRNNDPVPSRIADNTFATGGRFGDKNPLQRYYGQKNPMAKEALSLKCVPPDHHDISNISQLVCAQGDWVGGWIPVGYYASYHSSQPNSTNPTSCCYSIHKIITPKKK